MVFVVCGLNHKTAPLDLREQFASFATQNTLLENLLALPEVHEAVLLSTCNRTEIYCDTTDANLIATWLLKEQALPSETLKTHLYLHQDEKAMLHALRVVSGLDSMMLGEPQILGQIKQAYQSAYAAGYAKTELNTIFEYLFRAAKRIRCKSDIGKNPISIASAAVQLIGTHCKDYSKLRVFLIGSGETASLVAKYLQKRGANHFLVANRTLEHAEKLAQTLQGEAIPIHDIPLYLSKADVVISATACPLPFINKNMVENALLNRDNAPLFLLDLSVPRDIEPEVDMLDAVTLYNIDDLQRMTQTGMEERLKAAELAETLVESELTQYLRLRKALQANTSICDYRNQMQQIANIEVERALQKLAQGDCNQMVFTEFSQRLFNKLTHIPTVGLRQAAEEGRLELLDLAQYLFTTSTRATTYEEIP
jgi:glutamyl-tRNA reductase